MQELFLYLSGNIPGGFLFLIFLLLSINIALYYLYKSSKLFSKQEYKKNTSRFNIFLLTVYIFLWFYLKPPGLPVRVAFLPWQEGDSVNVVISETLEQVCADNLNEGYFLHQWEWYYSSADSDSIADTEYREDLAERLEIDIYITGNVGSNSSTFLVKINDHGAVDSAEFNANSLKGTVENIVNFVRSQIDILGIINISDIPQNYAYQLANAKAGIINGNYNSALNLTDQIHRESDVVKARALVQKGRLDNMITMKSDLKTNEINPYFQRAQKLLIPYSKDENDNAELNITLARLYMFQGDYETAEVCLKRAVSQDPFNARVYFMMGFLHKSRFVELGFKDRKTVLEKSIQLDPGSAAAVYELANEYYETGTGTASGYSTTYAINLLNNYAKINANNYKVSSLLGKIYLQSKYTLEAKAIFERLKKHFPDSAENSYNLGICYYHLKDYDNAESLFNDALQLGDEVDAYLYLGAISKIREQYDQALEYFRERIRRKTGADDHYAKEAMRQVRIILDELNQDSLQVENEEDKNPSGK